MFIQTKCLFASVRQINYFFWAHTWDYICIFFSLDVRKSCNPFDGLFGEFILEVYIRLSTRTHAEAPVSLRIEKSAIRQP